MKSSQQIEKYYQSIVLTLKEFSQVSPMFFIISLWIQGNMMESHSKEIEVKDVKAIVFQGKSNSKILSHSLS